MDYQIFNEDCIEGMKRLPDNSIDCIVTDLPYNLTACKWDLTPIDLPALWQQFKRILKPCCSVVMFASGKFTYKLVASNFEWYKYKWIWVKNVPTFFVHAKNAPMRKFEEILVFSDGVINHATCTTRRMKYNPQGVVSCTIKKSTDDKERTSQLRPGGRGKNWREHANWERHGRLKAFGDTLGARPSHVDYYIQEQTGYPTDVIEEKNWRDTYNWERRGMTRKFGGTMSACQANVDYYVQEQTGYPTDVLKYNVVINPTKQHPTQKPIDLLEYLIKTYTNEGETVLDATMGSGSTGVACVNTGRNFIGFETEKKFFDIANERITKAGADKEQRLF